MSATLERIESQAALVSKLAQGTQAHRQATEVLLILQDCLHEMTEAKAMIERVRAYEEAEARRSRK